MPCEGYQLESTNGTENRGKVVVFGQKSVLSDSEIQTEAYRPHRFMVCNKKYWKSIRLKAKLDELTQYNSVRADEVK